MMSTAAAAANNNNSSSGKQPIKKSPREFIIPIAVEGGGFVTPRAGSLEPSESGHSAMSSSAAFGVGRQRHPSQVRRLGSLLGGESSLQRADSEEDGSGSGSGSTAFMGGSGTPPTPGAFPHRLHRHTSVGRADSDADEASSATGSTATATAAARLGGFPMHRLRTTRPSRMKLSANVPEQANDSGSSGEDDDEDGFELLTAENLFSTLLSRVRCIWNGQRRYI